MDLADFPHLQELNLRFTAVKGDIREIHESDLSAPETLFLPGVSLVDWAMSFRTLLMGLMSSVHSILSKNNARLYD
jgi:hypothetical protein